MESGAFSLLIPLLCLLGLAEVTGSNQENQQVSIHDYCIVGAGPAGLQLGYFLKQAGRDYIIYDKADRPGSFFVRYPRHRMLISINKRFTGRKNRIFNERHDWNSLLSHDDSLRFPLYSDEFFPQADVLVKYLEDYQKKLGINVQFNTEVKNIVRLPPDVQTRNGTTFFMQDQHGNPLGCRVLIMATGWSQPKLVHFPGSEYVENYNDFDVNPRKYEGKSVLIIGRGNSAFETADAIYKYTNVVHMVSRSRIRLSWNTHYVGDLRGVNNAILDTYQLKSLDGLLEFDVSRMKLDRRNGKLYVSVDWGDQYNDSSIYPRVKPDSEDNFDNFPFRLPYDHVLSCLGFVFDDSPFHESTKQERAAKIPKFPAIRYDFQSWNTEDLYFAGTLAHSLDHRKSAGGFIHGFRYAVRSLHKIMEYRYHGRPWPSAQYPMSELLNVVVKRMNEAAGPYQMLSFLGDVVILLHDTFVYLEEFPVKLLPHFAEVTGHTGSQILVIINEYGPGFSGPDVDTLGPDRASTGGPMEAHKSNFLHPVLYYYDGYLPTEEEIMESNPKDWPYGLPKPSKMHHVVEDFLSVWLGSMTHVLPLRRFLETISGQDLRHYLNVHCFDVALNFANVPQSCHNFLDGRGLQFSVREGTDIVNYLLGETPAEKKKMECTDEDFDWVPNQVNRTQVLENRRGKFYRSTADIFAHDPMDETEEMESMLFIYEDRHPEYMIEDDDVQMIWRWSRSAVPSHFLDSPLEVLTEQDYQTKTSHVQHGLILFYLPWDGASRTAMEQLFTVLAEFHKDPDFQVPFLGTLNCFDWPLICEQEMINEYPTLRLIKDGHMLPYQRQLTIQELTSTLKLLQRPAVERIRTAKEAENFLSAETLDKYEVDNSVILVWPDLANKCDKGRLEVLGPLIGKYMFALADNSSSNTLYQKYGRHLGLLHRGQPWAIVARGSDGYIPHHIRSVLIPHNNRTISGSIADFTIPIFGELNAATYPMYARTGKPLVMLFGTEFQRIAPASILGHLAASNAFPQFHFVWLNSDMPGVLVATEDGGHIAILDQGMNKAFWYDENTSSEKDIRVWISDFLQGKLSPQGERPRADWVPAQGSYDFLEMIHIDMMAKKEAEMMAQELKDTMHHRERIPSMPVKESQVNLTSTKEDSPKVLIDTCSDRGCDGVRYGTYSHRLKNF